jgi:hypothetical protein
MGTSSAEIETGGSSVLVVGLLSLRSSTRELASQITRTDIEKGQTETEAVSEGDSSHGSRANLPMLVSEGTDQLSAAISWAGGDKTKGECKPVSLKACIDSTRIAAVGHIRTKTRSIQHVSITNH